jgi:phage terminase large subunit-like protein
VPDNLKDSTNGISGRIRQGFMLSGAIKDAERTLAGGKLLHGGRRLMTWCVGNAKVEPKGNAISINKQISGSAKIDLLMTTFDAVVLMAMNTEAKRSVYEVSLAGIGQHAQHRWRSPSRIGQTARSRCE